MPIYFPLLIYANIASYRNSAWQGLTNLPLDKMAASLADDIFKCIFLNENNRIMIQISVKFVPRSPIDNKLALVHW